MTKPAIAGSTRSVSAPNQQVIGNTTHRFSSWSDAQAQTHTLTMPSVNTSRTARFAPHTPGHSTLSFLAEADALVKSVPPTANDGAFDQLRTDGSPLEESYLRFIVGGISGKVTSAKLRLRSTNDTVDGPALRGTSNAWTEMGITWQNKPAATTGVVADTGMIGPGQWVEWDVTSLIGADGTYSFQLASTASDGVAFRAREYSNVSLRPELVVEVTNEAYARPQGASPLRVPLVPSYAPCTEPNRVHGSPLAHPSCAPPVRRSSALTVGTPDSNGAPANSNGFALLKVDVGDPATPADEADVTIALQLSDVRKASGLLADYDGELQFRPTLRLTDRVSQAAGTSTVDDFPLPVTVPCVATVDPLRGSDCNITTTADAVTPGLVDEGSRAIWELSGTDVLDGGADGDVDTPGNSVFVRSGIFVP